MLQSKVRMMMLKFLLVQYFLMRPRRLNKNSLMMIQSSFLVYHQICRISIMLLSGQNSEDQVACIVSNLKLKEINDLLLIHHDDKYGEIIKQSVQKNLIYHNLQNINLSLFEIDKNKDLNKEIKSISQFEEEKPR